jgi:uncharacterized membrane protein
MSEPGAPPSQPSAGGSTAAPPPPPPPSAPAGGQSPNRSLMIVLSYLGILAIIPLVAEKDDKEVQWHAKHGLVLLVAEVIVFVAISILSLIPYLGCVTAILFPIVGLGLLVLHILCIVKGVGGERFLIPGVSQYADRF